jgi:hypothetical protein
MPVKDAPAQPVAVRKDRGGTADDRQASQRRAVLLSSCATALEMH